jgi:hypothetical protein
MRIKKLYVIVLFQIAALCVWGQGADDILSRGEPAPEKKGVTMDVDTDVSPGAGKNAEQESIEQINEKWKTILLVKNKEIGQLYEAIRQMDSSSITKESIEDYTSKVNKLKKEIEIKFSNDLWKENDELVTMYVSFEDMYEKSLQQLKQWEEKSNQKKERMNPLLLIGICLLAVMAVVPIFTQIKSSVVVQRVKKEQERLAKKQKEDLERQMLLSDENNVITLKPKI